MEMARRIITLTLYLSLWLGTASLVGCGGEDLFIPGEVPIPTDAPDPTETPDDG